jgi:putative cell wall-binding protein
LLLTSGSGLGADVASELTRLKPAKVFLVGLPSSLASSVKAAVPSLTDPAQIVSLKGADRYETAALVARQVESKVGAVSKVIIAPGDSYAGALAASALAAARGWPLLLTPAAGPLPRATAEAIADLDVGSGIVVGTGLSIAIDGFTVSKRIVGEKTTSDPDGRYDACAKLAEYAVEQGWQSYTHLGLVSGEDFPDGEVTVPFVARSKGVLLFTKATSLPAATSAAIKSHGPEVDKIDFVGIGWPVYREVKSLNSARVTGLSVSVGPVAGGNTLVVAGAALNGASKVRVGKVDVPSGNWKVDSNTQLTITSVPAGHGDGPVEITVFNYWGASPSTVKDLYYYGDDGVLSAGEKVVREAVKYLGTPYLWAGSSPTSGFDCSGFTMYVYKQFGISLPHYSGSQATYGTAVDKANLQPGDLVFFYTPISHVGMYVGGGMMINAPRSGDLVCIEDAFRTSYVKARRLLSPYTRYEQTDSRLAYTGAWSTSSVSSASGGSFRFADSAGSSVTVKFTGTYLAWIAKKSPVYGKAKVTLDGGTPATVDLYSTSTLWQQKVWETGALATGAHTVKIEWTGSKSSGASGTNISADAFDIVGTLSQAPAAPAVRYEQKDVHFAYLGTWTTSSSSSASGGNFLFANSSGASVTVRFTGSYLAWIAKKSPVYGKAKVTVDGGTPTIIDLYSPSPLWKQKIWEKTLVPGTHTLKIEWTGTKGSGATDTNISVDAFDLIGVLQ